MLKTQRTVAVEEYEKSVALNRRLLAENTELRIKLSKVLSELELLKAKGNIKHVD